MKLDHVNVRTGRLDEMRKWYVDVLGMTDGWRPPFPFPGAWLYAGDDPIVHLVGVDSTPDAHEDDIRLEHFALRGDDLEALRTRIKSANLDCREVRVPGTDLLQLNIYDPDGNHIHIDFRTGESPA
jgi:catechol 2,3-dioxygenase-like lactoylglutathione lyase family enzyme